MTAIVIVGSGYAGVTLCELLNLNAFNVTLLTASKYFTSYPLLPQSFSGKLPLSVSQSEVSNFQRGNIKVVYGALTNVDGQNKKVYYVSSDENKKLELSFDHLILAIGGVDALTDVKGVRDHAVFFRSTEQAKQLRKRFISQLKLAQEDSENASKHLSFTIVGGGFTGVEIAAEFGDLMKGELLRTHKDLLPLMTVNLVHRGTSLVSSLQSSVISQGALTTLTSLGVNVKLETSVEEVGPDFVLVTNNKKVKSGDNKREVERIPSAVTVWCVGTTTSPVLNDVAASLNVPKLTVNPFLQVNGGNGCIYAIGDCMRFAPVPALASDMTLRSKTLEFFSTFVPTPQTPTKYSKEQLKKMLYHCLDQAAEVLRNGIDANLALENGLNGQKRLASLEAAKNGDVDSAQVSSILDEILVEFDTTFSPPGPSAVNAKAEAEYLVKTHFNTSTSFVPCRKNVFLNSPLLGIAYVGNGVGVMRFPGSEGAAGGFFANTMACLKDTLMVPKGRKMEFWKFKLFGFGQNSIFYNQEAICEQ